MATPEQMQALNELFAEEIEAAIRYLHLAVTVKGLDRLLVQKVLLANMRETIEHAQTIANKIVQLGGVPSLELRLSLAPRKASGAEAIRTALAFEHAALDAYRELLDTIHDDVPLEEFIRKQVEVEAQHAAELSLLLEE
ncbi:MAG: ferritin-like domain-containing protein [Planctomycetes bacterium]|nr:ferritin-like domain-containing protein [Planctomycetota bacterium]